MKESLVTVLSVDGDVYYNACCVCSTKVELIPDSNRGWCKNCRTCTSSPNKRYRLSLKVSEHSVPAHITIFGYSANGLFGCSANEFFRKVRELNLTDDQVKSAAETSLLSEVIRITRNQNGSVSTATFAVISNATKVIDRLLKLDATTDSNYSPFPVYCRPGGSHQLLRKHNTPSHLSKHTRSVVVNSTPLFSQLSLAALNVEDTLSPIIADPKEIGPVESLQFDESFYSPPASPMKIPTVKPATSKTSETHQQNTTDKSNVSKSESYSTVDIQRGKRRRCRVQCMVVDPPTQNNGSFNVSVEIRPPKLSDSAVCLESEDDKILKETKTDESDVQSSPGLLAKKVDDTDPLQFPLLQDNLVCEPGDVYLEPEVIAALMKSDDSIYDFESDKENTDPNPIKNDCSDISTTQDFDSFDIDNIPEIIELETAEKENSDPHSYRNQECAPVSSNSTAAASSNAAQESSDNDLFSDSESCDDIPREEGEGARPRQLSREHTFEWSMLSQMSSQEISKHFDFRLSESDDGERHDSESQVSDCSAELF